MRNEKFDEFLDEIYPVFKIGELTFYPSDIFYNLDPLAYEIAEVEWEDTQEEEED
jgi:hypothetical protein